MSAAYEFAKVAVPVATGIAAISAYVAIRWQAGKLRPKDKLFGGSSDGGFGFVPGDYGTGNHCDHGGHGHHGGHHGDCGGGHHGGDGGGGGHH